MLKHSSASYGSKDMCSAAVAVGFSEKRYASIARVTIRRPSEQDRTIACALLKINTKEICAVLKHTQQPMVDDHRINQTTISNNIHPSASLSRSPCKPSVTLPSVFAFVIITSSSANF